MAVLEDQNRYLVIAVAASNTGFDTGFVFNQQNTSARRSSIHRPLLSVTSTNNQFNTRPN